MRLSSILKKHYFFVLLLLSNTCFALDQTENLWLALASQYNLTADKKWRSFIYSQLHAVNESHPVQAGLIEGGIGHQLPGNKTVWFGYRWTGRNPNNGFYQENRLFQQIIWEKWPNHFVEILFRSRLEEIERTNETKISLRFRERIAVQLNYLVFKNAFPFLYEEVFFQLNKTAYTTNKLISENRIFIGFNLLTAKERWWEIGYINQFQLQRPQQTQNQMNHILSITYNLA